MISESYIKMTNKMKALFLFVFFLSSFQAYSSENIRVQLKWQHQFQFAGYYMAKELGFYDAVGINVSFQEALPNTNVVEEVLSGRAEFGIGTSDLILKRSEGAPVVVLGVIFQHSPQAIVIANDYADLGFKELSDKPLMIENGAADLLAMFQSEGVDPNSMQHLEHSFNIDSLLSKDVVGMSVYITDELFQLQRAGFSYRLFKPIDHGIDFYGDNFFTSEKLLKEKPDLVDAFINATKAGWAMAYKDPDHAIELIKLRYNSKKTIEELRFEAEQMIQLNQPSLLEPGYMNKARWQHIYDTYSGLDLVSFMPDLNRFLYVKKQINCVEAYKYAILTVVISCVLAAILAYVILLNIRLKKEMKSRGQVEKELIDSRDALKKANDDQKALINMFSHEYRTPLSVIKNTTALLEQQVTPQIPDTQPRFDMLWRAASRLVELVDNSLSPDRVIDFTSSDKTKGPCDILAVVKETIQSLDVLSDAYIALHTSEISKVYVALADSEVRKCLDNVISNALKYSAGQNVEVFFQKDTGFACIDVVDKGIGIPEQELEEVFLKYHRASNSEVTSGAGLGLFIVKRILESVGGSVAIDSTVGKGTTVSLFLPLIDNCFR
jgi:signal transduction histidine kinase